MRDLSNHVVARRGKASNSQSSNDAGRSPLSWMRYVFAAVTVSVVATLVYLGGSQWLTPGHLLVSEVQVTGAGKRVSIDDVMGQVQPFVDGGILHLSPEQISDQVARIEWVKSAEVRRIWPSRIELVVEEYEPALRWGETTWIDRFGDVFEASEQDDLTLLPRVHGPVPQRQVVIQRYLELNDSVKALGLSIESLVVDDREAWKVHFRSGLNIDLGREKFTVRWQRFASAYRILESNGRDPANTIDTMDLRYPHGLAITWRNRLASPVKG